MLFRDNHILAFLKNWSSSNSPLDKALSDYFKGHRSIGAQDRRVIGETIYTLVRWETLFEAIAPNESFDKKLYLFKQRPLKDWAQVPNLSPSDRLGIPKFLYEKISDPEICKVLQEPAPVSIRANLLKISRDSLFKKLADKFSVFPSTFSPTAIRFAKREPLFATEEFKAGLFEVQDEASQLIADLVEASPKDRVLDYCSGSGGKSLAIAPKMGGKGELYLHDIRLQALKEAKIRLKRAGVQNGQILTTDHPMMQKLKAKMDWVLVDAPCSGSGTLRRNPEMKRKICQEMIEQFCQLQKEILKNSVQYLKPKGRLVYATCSIFEEENEQIVEWAKQALSLKIEKKLSIKLSSNGPDGFFGAILSKF